MAIFRPAPPLYMSILNVLDVADDHYFWKEFSDKELSNDSAKCVVQVNVFPKFASHTLCRYSFTFTVTKLNLELPANHYHSQVFRVLFTEIMSPTGNKPP